MCLSVNVRHAFNSTLRINFFYNCNKVHNFVPHLPFPSLIPSFYSASSSSTPLLFFKKICKYLNKEETVQQSCNKAMLLLSLLKEILQYSTVTERKRYRGRERGAFWCLLSKPHDCCTYQRLITSLNFDCVCALFWDRTSLRAKWTNILWEHTESVQLEIHHIHSYGS